MVKIRLKRTGTTKRPVYRLVVADSRSPRDGRFIEAIGFYDPLPNPAVVRIDEEKVRVWMRKGARPSETARDLLIRQGILAASARPQRVATPAKKATEPAAAAVAAAPDAAAAETAADAAVDAAADAAPVIDEAPAADETAAAAETEVADAAAEEEAQ